MNTTRDGLRFSVRSSGRRYTGVSNVSRRQSLIDADNVYGYTYSDSKKGDNRESTRNYGTNGVEEC